ncbi:MAG: hypothetical protein D6798_12560 [Deltaproteobacteria bacterium]|nr:MAG: hypothetical protein D6798_12560 [Deltaproteobacteria bacterium]
MLLSLILACTPSADTTGADDTAPPVTDGGAGGHGELDGGGVGDGGGDSAYEDPVIPGVNFDLGGAAAELTDGARVGEFLLLVGQEQTTHGGAWAFDVAGPEPVLLGSTDIWNIQWVCGTPEGEAWGTNRDGTLYELVVGTTGVEIASSYTADTVTTGVDCDGSRVAWGMAHHGAAVGRKTDPGFPGDAVRISTEAGVQDVLLDGDTLWLVTYDDIQAWDLTSDGPTRVSRLELPGTCRDVALGETWLAVACGSGGVSLVSREPTDPVLLSSYADGRSARAVDVIGDVVLVGAWTDLLVLDAADPAALRFFASEPAPASAMAVVADPDSRPSDGMTGVRAWVVDWNTPFAVELARHEAPEVRLPTQALQGAELTVRNDGPELLVLQPTFGEMGDYTLETGQSTVWDLPDDVTDLALVTNDPDEEVVLVGTTGAQGLQPGDPAPDFVEQDLDGNVWTLDDLSGRVAFLGLLESGCPTCESEVADTDAMLRETFDEESDFVALWVFSGPESHARDLGDRLEITHTILTDSDDSVRDAYSPPGTGFARNPRHYVIDRDGVLTYVATTTVPGDLAAAISSTLSGD